MVKPKSKKGKKASNNEAKAQKYVAEFRTELIECGLAPSRVIEILFNIDETGLLFKRTYKFTGQEFMTRKPMDRITVLVGASMDGYKLKPVVVGKSLDPRALAGNCFILY